MSAVASLLLLSGGALGLGAALLRAFGQLARLGPWERWPWAFALGFGGIGWLLFPLGVAHGFNAPALAVLCALPLPGLWLLGRPGPLPRLDGWGRAMLAALAVVLLLDLAEALAPPSDGDSLFYHLSLPKQFLEAGGIVFVPRAVDAAVPLLVQLTYAPALALGGEPGLGLWLMASGWWTAALVFALARRHVSQGWAFALALAWLTIPAVVYGGGSGQVEVRNALFVLVAGVAVGRAVQSGDGREAALAGLAAGFFAGSKYTGLLLVGAGGLVLLMLAPRRLTLATAFAAAALVAGGEWYLWNLVHTGDPLFPLLHGALGLPDGPYWNAAIEPHFRAEAFWGERSVPPTPIGLLAYPILATFGNDPTLESQRTGYGPLPWLLIPFAAAALWRWRDRIRAHPLTPAGAVVLIAFVAWFFTTPSQRVRHVLPLLPLLLLCLTAAAARWAGAAGATRPLAAAFALAILFQITGAFVFAVNPLRYLVSGESRDAYLGRIVSGADAAPWVNRRLGPGDRLLHFQRNIDYLFEVPRYFGSFSTQAVIDFHGAAADQERFWRRLRAQGITHVLMTPGLDRDTPMAFFPGALAETGCVRLLDTLEGVRSFPSRTLAATATETGTVRLWALTPGTCAWERR